MKTKPEIKEKLEQAEKEFPTANLNESQRLEGVLCALRWVLDLKITSEPKDPVSEE